MDWADKIEQAMLDSWLDRDADGVCEYFPKDSQIAAALRKAKAEGMREAAQMVDLDRSKFWGPGDYGSQVFLWNEYEIALRNRADAIEKGA